MFQTEPPKTQLEIRQFQTRTYATKNTKMIMKAMLNVLQDDGFMVKQVNLELGLLSATKESDVESSWDKFLSSNKNDSRWKKAAVMECTANVSEFGKKSQVRATFSEKILDNKGDVMGIEQIQNANFYQDFFVKVDKGIFIQKEKL